MKRILILILFVFASLLKAYSQDSIKIHGQFKNNVQYAKVVVKKFGLGSYPVSNATIIKERFSLSAPKNIEPGVYRFQYGQRDEQAHIDIIINGDEQEIDFILDVSDRGTFPVFMKSIENRNWYEYQKESHKLYQKVHVLQAFLSDYPNNNDRVVVQAYRAFQNGQTSIKQLKRQFLERNQDSWAAMMVANDPIYFSNPRDLPKIKDYKLKINFWNGINTNNPLLLNSPLYTEKILSYLQYYMNPDMQFSEKEMVNGFKKSIDTIMNKFGGNEETRSFALKYLQMGFKEIGQEEVLQYLDENYAVVEQCENDLAKANLEERLKGYARIKKGMPAPDVAINDLNGNSIVLKEIAQDSVVLVFWASWCPHCQEMMPLLNQWAGKQKNTKVIAISLDKDKSAFIKSANQYLNINHHSDFYAWDSEIVSKYYVSATPTLFLLDDERKIAGKYPSFHSFLNQLKQDLN